MPESTFPGGHWSRIALLLDTCTSPPGSAVLGGFAGDQSVAACAQPGLGLVLWKVSLGKPIPRASFHIPLPQQRGQGPRTISQLPSSPSPPLAPNAAPPCCQVSTLPPQDCHTVVALSTQQIKERKAPRKHCNMS